MKRFYWFFVASSTVLILLLNLNIAVSAEKSQNSGIKIAPLRSYPTQSPGDTSVGKIDVTNLSDSPQKITLSTEQFKTINEKYEYEFSSGEEINWIRYPDTQLILAAHETKTVAYSLAVPASAKPGGYYLAMIATSQNSKSTTDVNIVKRVASIVYLEVSGDIVRKTNLITFELPWLTTRENLSIDIRIANEGNSHDRSRVGVTYKMWPFGKTSDQKIVEGLTLPATIRKLNSQMQLPKLPGLYQVDAEFSPPQGGTFHKTRLVIYTPIWAIVLVIILLTSGVFAWWKILKKAD